MPDSTESLAWTRFLAERKTPLMNFSWLSGRLRAIHHRNFPTKDIFPKGGQQRANRRKLDAVCFYRLHVPHFPMLHHFIHKAQSCLLAPTFLSSSSFLKTFITSFFCNRGKKSAHCFAFRPSLFYSCA